MQLEVTDTSQVVTLEHLQKWAELQVEKKPELKEEIENVLNWVEFRVNDEYDSEFKAVEKGLNLIENLIEAE